MAAISHYNKNQFIEMVNDSLEFDIEDFTELYGSELVKYYPHFRKFRRDEDNNLMMYTERKRK